jgi:Phage tail lysozyme
MAINSSKLLPPSNSSGIVLSKSNNQNISKKLISSSDLLSSAEMPNQRRKKVSSQILIIKTQVIKIEKIVNGRYLEKIKSEKEKQKLNEKNRRKEREEKLEKSQEKEEKFPNVPKLPKLGFLDGIKNFIGNMILGFVAYRLIEHLPAIANFLKFLAPAVDFFIDFSGKLLDGLVTFVDWGYKAYDNTRRFLKNLGGENTLKVFDGFIGAMDKVIEASIIAAFAFSELRDDSGGGTGDRVGIRGRRGAPGRSQYGVDSRAARRYAERYGRDAAIRKFGREGVESLGGKYARSGLTNLARKGVVATLGKSGTRQAIRIVKPLVKNIPLIGGIIEFILSWISGDPVGKAAFKGVGAGLGVWAGGALGTLIGGPIGAGIGMWLGSEGGSALGNLLYDKIFNNKDPKEQKVQGRAEGGTITRGSEVNRGIARKAPTKKVQRVIRVQQKEVEPGKSIGGEKEIKKIFPEPESKDKSKTINPLGYMEKSHKEFSKIPGFGGLASIFVKAQLGEDPTKADYQSAAGGLESWMQKTFSDEVLRTGGAFAEGGEVDVGMFTNSSDMRNMIAKSLQDSIAPKIDETIKDLREQLMLKEIDRGKEPGEGPGAEDEPTGSPTLVGNTNAEKVFRYLVDKEGFTPEAAAGVIGNLMQESGVNPKSRQLGGGPGRGIMQWTETERWASLTAWANNSGKDPWTLETQVEWMIKEMKDYGTYNRIKGVTSYKKAVEIFEKEMERAGVPNYPRRYQFAADALASFSGGAGGAGISLGSQKMGAVDQFTSIAKGFGLQLTSDYRPGDSGYHGKNRARDYSNDSVGRGTPQQLAFAKHLVQNYGSSLTQLIYTPLGFGIANGKKVGLDYWGESVNSQHYHHVHVALEKGGLVDGTTYAKIGEKGREFVLDSNTTEATRGALPGFLEALNSAKNVSDVLKVIRFYMPYESESPQQVIIENNPIQDIDTELPQNNRSFMMSGSGGGSSSDPFDILDRLPG